MTQPLKGHMRMTVAHTASPPLTLKRRGVAGVVDVAIVDAGATNAGNAGTNLQRGRGPGITHLLCLVIHRMAIFILFLLEWTRIILTLIILLGWTHIILLGWTHIILPGWTHIILLGWTHIILLGWTHIILLGWTHIILLGWTQLILPGWTHVG